ncbi:complex I NDUFA9 subunit family protein [Sphingobium sufflavum]|uniref:complex I NDUFA9 subunit family protein n=1 Tax=Sphingobium sufflavum TaxID=1129547 RepID=UPI001F249A6B|nr:complex I NDUFA9 subunit family protein [Sphingobium sufflavum]MCE7796507.1 complex I NDUFA9 subunit family protein [Sphingobium sufflavum]
METKLVTIFGGGGFVGRALAQELFARGWRVRIAQREPRRAFAVKALGSLGQTQFAAADITRPDSVARAVAGADAVVNLVGLLKGDFEAAHVTGAETIARATAAAGIPTLVHVSAIGADSASPSAYGRTKGEGEAAVRAVFPAATIVRPSIIFGRDDKFTNRFAGLIRSLPVVPLIAAETKFQPVFVADVAKSLAEAVANPGTHAGKTYALGGPDILSMAQINAWLAEATGRTPSFIPLPAAASCALATLTGWAPGAPITKDQLAMLATDNVVDPALPGLAELGVKPTPLAAVAPSWLTGYRKHGRFGDQARA